MKIFISWAGTEMKLIAESIKTYLNTICAIKTEDIFFSPDIDKGTFGRNEIDNALGDANYGLFCLNKENFNNTWISYEAGAISKLENSRCWTLLFNMTPNDFSKAESKPPISEYQHTIASDSEDIKKLFTQIFKKNMELNVTDSSQNYQDFEKRFEKVYPILKNEIENYEEKIKTIGDLPTDNNITKCKKSINDKIFSIVNPNIEELKLEEQNIILNLYYTINDDNIRVGGLPQKLHKILRKLKGINSTEKINIILKLLCPQLEKYIDLTMKKMN
jgi:hypothetical protein